MYNSPFDVSPDKLAEEAATLQGRVEAAAGGENAATDIDTLRQRRRLGAHRHGVRDGRRTEGLRIGARLLQGCDCCICELLEPRIAGGYRGMSVRNAHHRLVEILGCIAQRIKHGAIR